MRESPKKGDLFSETVLALRNLDMSGLLLVKQNAELLHCYEQNKLRKKPEEPK